MARSYAGVLGTLAFGMILVRGLIAGSGLECCVASACLALFCFAALGCIAGQLAERFTGESVRSRLPVAKAPREVNMKKSPAAK
ncbi:MAG TPA: hypothetical protein VFB96_24540 [Pirellulaceae bacterium]|jgi:hypothetical protein|nr:hypothetical protein [Pirellulaceae bacterium]